MTVKYHTWLDPRMSLDDLSAQLMRDADGRDGRVLGAPQARMTPRPSSPADRDDSRDDARPIDARWCCTTIRQARERLALSLFRCNDKAVFDELTQARERGVSVDVLVTSRAKGGKKRLRKLWQRARGHRRRDSRLHRSGRQVPRQVSRRRRRPGAGRVAELHAQVLRQDERRDRRHPRSGGRERAAQT